MKKEWICTSCKHVALDYEHLPECPEGFVFTHRSGIITQNYIIGQFCQDNENDPTCTGYEKKEVDNGKES